MDAETDPALDFGVDANGDTMVGWVARHFSEEKCGPGECKMQKYMTSFYWAVMTMTTVRHPWDCQQLLRCAHRCMLNHRLDTAISHRIRSTKCLLASKNQLTYMYHPAYFKKIHHFKMKQYLPIHSTSTFTT